MLLRYKIEVAFRELGFLVVVESGAGVFAHVSCRVAEAVGIVWLKWGRSICAYIYRQINKALYDSCAPHRAGRT